MTTAAHESQTRSTRSKDDSIKASLNLLRDLLDQASDHFFDADYFESLSKELRRLHARIRIHHAVDQLAENQFSDLSPELTEEVKRLQAEHAVILGKLDRLVRSVDSMADRSLEDKDVFLLRGFELIALLRRHEAEEDRLFYLSVWCDTGGES